MIAWLRGRVINISGNEITLNTGNIGYCVYIGDNKLLQMGVQTDQEIELVIYTVVKEDDIRLYGFDSFLTRNIFSLLLEVSGIGPKAAINIVDKLEPPQIISAIQSADYSPFLSISGIGKKTAQRIILDLQGKLERFKGNLIGEENYAGKPLHLENVSQMASIQLIKDARSALSNLGFNERESERVIRQHLKPGIGLDEIIRKSLADLRQ